MALLNDKNQRKTSAIHVQTNSPKQIQKGNLLCIDEILHHFETMGNHCSLVFTEVSSFQGLLAGAGFRPSAVWRECLALSPALTWRRISEWLLLLHGHTRQLLGLVRVHHHLHRGTTVPKSWAKFRGGPRRKKRKKKHLQPTNATNATGTAGSEMTRDMLLLVW